MVPIRWVVRPTTTICSSQFDWDDGDLRLYHNADGHAESPIEFVFQPPPDLPPAAGSSLPRRPGAAQRALHVDTERAGSRSTPAVPPSATTPASTPSSTAASPDWIRAKTGVKPFVGGAANPTEVFPAPTGRGGSFTFRPALQSRRATFPVRYQWRHPAPKNRISRQPTASRPRRRASSRSFGTSAAAPHAAAVAALVKDARRDIPTPDPERPETNGAWTSALREWTAIRGPASSWAHVEAVHYALTH